MNVLITGKNSYIGKAIKSHLTNFGHFVDDVDTISNEWQNIDYSKYDSIIHVAAIVHDNAKTASAELFRKVNTILPFDIATRAKECGVKQFVFLSTMAVYGISKSLNHAESIVTTENSPYPQSLYGKSKLEAEQKLNTLADGSFRIAIVRPPNVYGKGCGGNYIPLFKKLADMLRICPEAYTDICQSMLYIDNLSELIRLIVETNSNGLFLPQDDKTPSTVQLIKTIRDASNKKTTTSKFVGLFVRFMSKFPIIKKIYGGVSYSIENSNAFDYQYQIVPFEQGIALTYCNDK